MNKDPRYTLKNLTTLITDVEELKKEKDEEFVLQCVKLQKMASVLKKEIILNYDLQKD